MLGFIIGYFLGGITFIPLILGVAFLLFKDLLLPEIAAEKKRRLENGIGLKRVGDEDPVFSTPEKEHRLDRRSSGHDGDVAAGYFAVTREWVPGGVNGKPPER